MTHDYFILKAVSSETNCVVDKAPPEIRNAYRMLYGEPISPDYPRLPKFHMSSRRAGKKVPDVIYNTPGYLMASDRLKALVETECGGDVEYLPFTLIDHKGKAVPGARFIINVLGTHDCVDRSRTEGTESAMEPGTYQFIEKLYLHDGKIPRDRKLFRASAKPQWLLVRDDLRRRMEEEKISGVAFRGLGEPLPAFG